MKHSHFFSKKDYLAPVLHLEFLKNEELYIAWQVLDSFDIAEVPFCAITRERADLLQLNIFNAVPDEEVEAILDELANIEALDGYKINAVRVA